MVQPPLLSVTCSSFNFYQSHNFAFIALIYLCKINAAAPFGITSYILLLGACCVALTVLPFESITLTLTGVILSFLFKTSVKSLVLGFGNTSNINADTNASFSVITSSGSLLVKIRASVVSGLLEEYPLLKEFQFTCITPSLIFHEQ